MYTTFVVLFKRDIFFSFVSMRYLFLICVFVVSSSCESQFSCDSCEQCGAYEKRTNQMAAVESKNGVMVFVMSEPLEEYEVLGVIPNNFGDDIAKSTKGEKKFGKILKSIVETSAGYVSLNQVVTLAVNKAREAHPKADAVVFVNNLSEVKVVKFK